MINCIDDPCADYMVEVRSIHIGLFFDTPVWNFQWWQNSVLQRNMRTLIGNQLRDQV